MNAAQISKHRFDKCMELTAANALLTALVKKQDRKIKRLELKMAGMYTASEIV